MPGAPDGQEIGPVDCGDARERFPALLRGRATLTDYALVEVHVTHCAPCRQELKQLQQSVRRRRPARGSQRLKLAGAAAVTVVLSVALVASLVYRLPKLQSFFTAPSAPFESVVPPAEAPSRQSAPAPPEPPADSTALRPGESMPTLPPRALPPPPKPARSRSVASTEPMGGLPKTDSKGAAPISQRVPPATDVLGRLTVKDLKEAERRLAGLLAGVAGARMASGPRGSARWEFVALVPQLNYSKFTEGLAQIGSWQVEARRPSLPDMVRVKVRLIEQSG